MFLTASAITKAVHSEQFSEPSYTAACRKAIDINDPKKAETLLANAGDRVAELSPSFHGEMACLGRRWGE